MGINSSRATQTREEVVLRTTRSASPRLKPGVSCAIHDESNEAGWRALHQSLTNAGFDCIAYRNETEDPGELSWIVWDHKKIHQNKPRKPWL